MSTEIQPQEKLEEEGESDSRPRPWEMNIYFNLDITLPKPQFPKKHKSNLKKDKDEASIVIKGAGARPEEEEGDGTQRHGVGKQARKPRQVHFAQIELHERTHLPYCRRRQNRPTQQGILHARFCRNSWYETEEVLGEQTWINHIFIVGLYNQTAKIMTKPANLKATRFV